MEIIAIDELGEFLRTNLPYFREPVLMISPKFLPGCSKCGSDCSVLYVKLNNKQNISQTRNLIEVTNHKLPLSIYYIDNRQSHIPKKVWLGTNRHLEGLELKIKKIQY